RGFSTDSPTALRAAQWITASYGLPANTALRRATSRTSTSCTAMSVPTMRPIRSGTSCWALTKLSTMTGSWPASASATQTCLPTEPDAPVTMTRIGTMLRLEGRNRHVLDGRHGQPERGPAVLVEVVEVASHQAGETPGHGQAQSHRTLPDRDRESVVSGRM